MKEHTFVEAIRMTLFEEMRSNPSVFLMGTDVGLHGGLFKLSHGLLAEFGENRVIDLPVSESAAVGAGVGAAVMGLRPVVDLHYSDFLAIAMDQVVSNAANMRYLTNGILSTPLTIMATFGFGASAHHSHSPEAWLQNIPGLKVVMPSTPADARGLLRSSIQDDNPVIYLSHRKLLGTRGPVPEEDSFSIPIGQADVKREGKDVTIIARGLMVTRALEAAEHLERTFKIDSEVIDLRTVRPMDQETLISSVMKTSRAVIVEESPRVGGVGGDIASILAEEALGYLDAPIIRVSAPDTPIPVSHILLEEYVPSVEKIISSVCKIVT